MQKEDGDYIWACYQSAICRFIDDLECRIDTNTSVIHIRSASRAGHSDLDANRSRAARLRSQFLEHQKQTQ